MEGVWKGLRYKDAANAVFYHGDCAFDAAFTPRVIGVKMQLDSSTIALWAWMVVFSKSVVLTLRR